MTAKQEFESIIKSYPRCNFGRDENGIEGIFVNDKFFIYEEFGKNRKHIYIKVRKLSCKNSCKVLFKIRRDSAYSLSINSIEDGIMRITYHAWCYNKYHCNIVHEQHKYALDLTKDYDITTNGGCNDNKKYYDSSRGKCWERWFELYCS